MAASSTFLDLFHSIKTNLETKSSRKIPDLVRWDQDLTLKPMYAKCYSAQFHESTHGEIIVKFRPYSSPVDTWIVTEMCILSYLGAISDPRTQHLPPCLGYVTDPTPGIVSRKLGMSLRRRVHQTAGEIARRRPISFQYQQLLKLLQQVASTLSFLHQSGVIHRDVWIENIRLDSNENAVLVGFESAAFYTPEGSEPPLHPFTDHQHLFRKGGALGFRWAAPEMLINPETASPASDVWAFGILMWSVFANGATIPYPSEFGIKDCLKFIHQGNLSLHLNSNPEWPSSIREMILECLNLDPSQRPTMEELQNRLMADTVLTEVNAYEQLLNTRIVLPPLQPLPPPKESSGCELL